MRRRRRGCCFVVLVTFRRAGGRERARRRVARSAGAARAAPRQQRAGAAAGVACGALSELNCETAPGATDWSSAVGPLHLPHAHASCNRTSPLCRHKCDSRQYQAAATSHHRCRSGARGRCREAESPATSASPRPVLLSSNGNMPSSSAARMGEQLLLQATSSAPLLPATPRDGVLKAASPPTFGAADLASWAAALTSIAKAKWVVQAAITGRRARRSRPTMDDQFGSVSDSASTGWLAQGPAF